MATPDRALSPGRILFLFMIGALLLASCRSGLERASLAKVDQMEQAWLAAPVPSYHIVVDVDRPGDRRRNELVVEDGVVVQATVKYWNPERKAWDEPFSLNQEQAEPFTVPGLFEMVREQIELPQRAQVQVKWREDPPMPELIVLGPVSMNGQPVSGTEATVFLEEFEPLAK